MTACAAGVGYALMMVIVVLVVKMVSHDSPAVRRSCRCFGKIPLGKKRPCMPASYDVRALNRQQVVQ